MRHFPRISQTCKGKSHKFAADASESRLLGELTPDSAPGNLRPFKTLDFSIMMEWTD